MRVVVRADASFVIGGGHVMRCLTLAGALREKGAVVSFVCREQEGHLCDVVAASGFPVARLTAPGGTPPSHVAAATTPHAAHLHAPGQDDADETRRVIEALDTNPEWLVVDHYGLGRDWECALRPSVGRIMAIDDLGDRTHDCDLLLDQNLMSTERTHYADKVPTSCGMLLGPEYALLQPAYRELHDRVAPREGTIKRILIFFGSGDSDNLTGRAITAFEGLGRRDIELDVVVTGRSPHSDAIRRQVARHSNVSLYDRLPTLAQLMVRADLAIGAGGATSWERCCLGLPSLVVTLSDNQRLVAARLQERGLIRWLGHKDEVEVAEIARAIRDVIERGLDEDWSLRCLAAVDGGGAQRVCAALTVTAATPLRVRYATLADESLLLEWANDPTTRRNAFSPEPIPAGTHRQWFRSRLRDPDGCRLFVVETEEGAAVGQVRFQRGDESWEVHYSLAPVFRGRRLGGSLLNAALMKLRASELGAPVFGQVKSDNRPSQRVFESLGFERRPSPAGGTIVYQRVL